MEHAASEKEQNFIQNDIRKTQGPKVVIKYLVACVQHIMNQIPVIRETKRKEEN